MESAAGVFVVLVVLVISLRLLVGGLDGERIDAYLAQRGCEVLDRSWAPFGKGWFGERNDRIYEVVYRDPSGGTRRATVKTSLFADVYLTDDRSIEAAPPAVADDTLVHLRAENERLRAELERRGDGAAR